MSRPFFALFAIFSLFVGSISATTTVVPVGVVGSNDVSVAVAPSSTIVVTLQLKTEEVTVGPYARYAQKLLGLRAPLVAKSTTTILGADIELAPEDHHLYRGACDKREVTTTISPLPIDASANGVLPVELAAEAAAKEIFNIRRIRREMISGDLGEGFFGGGLGAALERMDLEEQSYLELFMGRTTTTYESRAFDVAVDGDVTRYIVCRYSSQLGVVDSSDLAAEPLLLQITPSGKKPVTLPAAGDKPARKFRVADRSTCELYFGSKLLDSSVLPLFEYGYEIQYQIK